MIRLGASAPDVAPGNAVFVSNPKTVQVTYSTR